MTSGSDPRDVPQRGAQQDAPRQEASGQEASRQDFPQPGIGGRLRQAREAAGLSVVDVGQRLKMPARVVQSLEAEDWGRLGAPVFVRGQLRSYARLLRLPVEEVVQRPELAPVVATELKPRSYTPRMQRIAEQASRRAVYIVLTVAILVPVWVATRPGMERIAREAAPLDAPAAAGSARNTAAPAPAREREPVRASLAPIPRAASAPALSLQFEGDSWVEIRGTDGQVIESGLFKAGDQRSFDAGEVGAIKLGNAPAVRVLHEGQVQDLAPYLRASVARFAVSSDGSLAPPAE
jgi:cytoskeleton protein RodZ